MGDKPITSPLPRATTDMNKKAYRYLSNPRTESVLKTLVLSRVRSLPALDGTAPVITLPVLRLHVYIVASALATCTTNHSFPDNTILLVADNV
jgi:hypothetical protein